MKFAARVVVVFPADQTNSKMFDVWEMNLILDSNDPREALTEAISISRQMLDEAPNWQALGYSEKPVMHAVQMLQTFVELPRTLDGTRHHCHVLTKTISLNENELEKLRSFEDVSTTFRVTHIDGQV